MRRDRRGRGARGVLAPAAVPLAASPADRFDRIASEAVEHVEHRWRDQLAAVDFAVDLVPPTDVDLTAAAAEGAIDAGGVLLAQIVRRRHDHRAGTQTCIVLYRKPIELRARDAEDLEDLVHDVVVQVISNYLGLDPDVVDPGFGEG